MVPARTARSPAPRRTRRVKSLLVRLWHEPRELDGADPLLRTYVRDLQSGEEAYLPGLDALALHLAHMVEAPVPDDDADVDLEPLRS